jgi:hypothetical protein
MAPFRFAVANIVQKIKLQNKIRPSQKKNLHDMDNPFLFHGIIG